MAKEQLTSICAAFTPIVTALVKAEDILGPNRNWQPSNPRQTEFLNRYFSQRSEIEKTLADASPAQPLKIDSIASYTADEINEFLAKKGFNITLNPFTSPGEFGTASVMDVLVKWLNPGKSGQKLKAINNENYPAVILNGGVGILHSPTAENPLAYISTQHPDYKVWMTIPGKPIVDSFTLLDYITDVRKGPLSIDGRHEGLIFPKVSLDQRANIDWLKQMETTGKDGLPAIISQALQQTKYRMNEIGARAESAVAIGMTRGFAVRKEPLVIDRPFVTWMEKKGISFPLFAGYIDYPDWKDPGSLE